MRSPRRLPPWWPRAPEALSEPTLRDDTVELARIVEALLFLSSDPLSIRELADAAGADELEIAAAVGLLAEQYAPGLRGIQLRELAGGYALASDPACEEAARRLFSRPRAATLTPAQAETLAIVAYLQPVSRPEITRIRGVSADSAATTLLERGLIEEAGRSQFGAVLYRTGTQFLKLFGLRSLSELPDVAQWDPTPEEQAELRERLLRAGEARAEGRRRSAVERWRRRDQAALAASWPHAASMSRPRVRRTVACTPCSSSAALKAAIASRLDPRYGELVGLKGIRLTLNISGGVRARRGEQLRQRHRLRVAVVDARQHHVLDEDPPPLARVVGAARLEHLAQRVALVDRHQLRAQRFVGRVQRERQAQRQRALREAFDPGDPPHRRDRRAAMRDAEIRQPLAGPSTASRFSSGSPIPMNTQWSTRSSRRKCSAWSRISEVVRLRANRIAPVAQKVQVSGQPDCEERQIERRPPPSRRVPPPGEFRYRISTASSGRPSAVANSAFTVPSRALSSRRTSRLENGTSRASASRSACGRLVIASYPAAPPAAHRHTWAARKLGSPCAASVLSRSCRSILRGRGPRVEAVGLLWWQPCASPSTSPTPASPRGAPPRR